MRKLLYLFILIGSTILYGYYHKSKLDNYFNQKEDQKLLAKIPNISLNIFSEQKTVNLLTTAMENKFTVVHFWATWCGPCEKEFPDLVRLIKRLEGKSIRFLLVAVNDDPGKVKKFIKKFEGITQNYLLLEDNLEMHREHFGISKLPETFVFDQNGKTIRALPGPQEWLSAPFLNYFDSLANQ